MIRTLEKEDNEKIIKEALAEKGFAVTINWIESASYIGFDVDLNICEKDLYVLEVGEPEEN